MPVLGTEITEFLVLASQFDGPEDNLLVGPFFLLDYPDVISLRPGRRTRLRVVEQLCYSVRIKPGQGGNPTVAQGIEIWCRKNISERIVVPSAR